MKKSFLSLIVVSFGFMQIEAKPKVFDHVKAKTSQAWLSTKATAAYVVSSIRESNSIKMQRALQASDAVLKFESLLQLQTQTEDGLLKNVQTLGYDKQNALSALTLIERYYSDMIAIASRYNSKVARWNKCENMAAVLHTISPSLRICKEVRSYLRNHKECLRSWEIISFYQDFVTSDKGSKALATVKSSDFLQDDIDRIKLCVTKKSFRLSYPETYKKLYEYLPVLECKLDLIVQ